jgi:hypothetical protein
VLDANGDIESEVDITKVDYGNSYRSAGVINITNELVKFCEVVNFPQFIVALMKHSALLLAGGYGEEPEDIVAGFNAFEFLVRGCEYEFVEDGMDPFVGLEKQKATMLEDEELVVRIKVNEDEFDQPLNDKSLIVAFLCSTIPVV